MTFLFFYCEHNKKGIKFKEFNKLKHVDKLLSLLLICTACIFPIENSILEDNGNCYGCLTRCCRNVAPIMPKLVPAM